MNPGSLDAASPNGSSPVADQGHRVLVSGGAGYIGCVLVARLLERGYRVRIVDRLYFGEDAIAGFREQVELVVADIRDIPGHALDDVHGVIHLAALSNDPTAEFEPAAAMQINAFATEALAQACVERSIARYVFSSTCSLYDGLPPGIHAEDAKVAPLATYAVSKRYAEERLLGLAGQGLCPVILRSGTVYGWSPRMRFDLVVNTFVKDALLLGNLTLHGGGGMWRPLVDVRDCADALIAAYEAPEEDVRGETFNVVHANHRIHDLATIVAGAVQLAGRSVTVEKTPPVKSGRDYKCSNAKLATRLGFVPRHSVIGAVTDLVGRLDSADRSHLTHPRHYNIRWLERFHDIKSRLDTSPAVL